MIKHSRSEGWKSIAFGLILWLLNRIKVALRPSIKHHRFMYKCFDSIKAFGLLIADAFILGVELALDLLPVVLAFLILFLGLWGFYGLIF